LDIDIDALLPRKRKKPPPAATPEQLAQLGEPGRFKYVSAKGEVIWQSQDGMQTDLFHLSHVADEILVGGLRGPGKASSLDSMVCTPHGMRPMRDISVGSLVSNPDGGVAKVIATFPQGEKDCYRFTFSDGAQTIVTDDHLWLARRTCRPLKGDRRYFPFAEEDRVPYKIWTTRQLIRLLDEQSGYTWREQQSNLLIPLANPVEFTSAHWGRWATEIGIDAYALGLLIGDGCFRQSIRFTTADEELIGELRQRTRLEFKQSPRRPIEYHVYNAGFRNRLRAIGLWDKVSHQKFVPEIYLKAPAEVRLELLRGLMDTDGSVDDRDGLCSFSSVSKQLAEDVQYLARSLGYRARIRQKEAGYRKESGEWVQCRDAYEISIQGQNTKDLFRLERKRSRCRDTFNGGTSVPHRRIENIEYAGKREAQCIAVDHPNQLYITDDFIVTHNTDALIAWMAEPAQYPEYRGIMLRFSQVALDKTLDRCQEIWGAMGATRHNRPYQFRFPSGATIYTGHLKDNPSIEAYRGHQYHRVGFEEASQIADRKLYLMLLATVRSVHKHIPAKVCITSNPDGPGNDWLKRRFINVYAKGPSGTIEKVEPKVPFKDPIEKKTRVFIPGTRFENKILLDVQPHYYEQFAGLPESTRRAWVEGDWDAPASQFFPEFRPDGPLLTDGGPEPPEACHVIPARDLPTWSHRWASCDWGYAHHMAIHWGCYAPDKRIHIYREYVARKIGSDEAGAEFARRSWDELRDNPELHLNVYMSHEAFSMRDRGKTLSEQFVTGCEAILGPGGAFCLQLTNEEKELEQRDPDAALRLLVRRREEFGNRVRVTVRRCNPDKKAGWSYFRTLLRWKRLKEHIEANEEHAKWLLENRGLIEYHAYLDMFNNQEPEILPGLLIHGPSQHGDGCPILIETIPKAQSNKDKPDEVLEWHSDDDIIGDDPLDSARFLVMGHHDIEGKVPFPVWLEEEIAKHIPDGVQDINRRIQVARRQEEKYRKANDNVGFIESVPRECMSLRTLSYGAKH
jgi:hypothetical protein